MTIIQPEYVHAFPMIPGGGLFFVPIGICIVLGAFLPRLRMALVWIGMAVGVLAIVLGGNIFKGLPPPTLVQVIFFAMAIVAEVVAFRVFIPRLRTLGDRGVLAGTLGIVGAHFLIMVPTFGAPIFLLAVLCLANASVAYKASMYPVSSAWLVDGVFKMAVGSVMVMASPVMAATH